jgi:hypothetical protein
MLRSAAAPRPRKEPTHEAATIRNTPAARRRPRSCSASDRRPNKSRKGQETSLVLGLEEKLQRGAITSEEADEIYHLIFQQSKDRGQRNVPGQL